MPPWANDHATAYLQAKTVPMNLIWSELAQWLWSFGIRKIPGALITPMGMHIMPPWANDHTVAYLQPKGVPINFIWNKSAQWLLSYGILKFWPDALDRLRDGRTNGWRAFHSPPFFLLKGWRTKMSKESNFTMSHLQVSCRHRAPPTHVWLPWQPAGAPLHCP